MKKYQKDLESDLLLVDIMENATDDLERHPSWLPGDFLTKLMEFLQDLQDHEEMHP